MPNDTVDRDTLDAAAGDKLDRFYADLANGLHALAQPLTILQSTVGASSTPGCTTDRQQHYRDVSLQQVERACNIYWGLQNLVVANQAAADRTSYDLSHVLAPLLEDQQAVLTASGIELSVSPSFGGKVMHGDASRTLQAIQESFKIAASRSSPGDVIELKSAISDGRVELSIANSRLYGKVLNSLDRLNMAVAETNIRSQQGDYSYSDDPFRVVICLPIQCAGSL
jgi:hypothetical protein